MGGAFSVRSVLGLHNEDYAVVRSDQVKIFNENIVWTKETKYLGVTLDSKLTFRTHISCILRKANYRLRQLFPILNKSSTIDIN
jgi:hypothetical protein